MRYSSYRMVRMKIDSGRNPVCNIFCPQLTKRLFLFSGDLRLENLVNKIMETLKGQFFPGEEVIFMEGNMMRPCKVLKVMETDHGRCKTAYEIGLLDNNKNVMSTIVGESVRLLRKKNPFTRALLKSFIRESVKGDLGKNAHWVVHDKLCQEYKVPTDPPDELKKPLTFPSEISSVRFVLC